MEELYRNGLEKRLAVVEIQIKTFAPNIVS